LSLLTPDTLNTIMVMLSQHRWQILRVQSTNIFWHQDECESFAGTLQVKQRYYYQGALDRPTVTSWWFHDTIVVCLVVGLTPSRVRWNGSRFRTHSGTMLGVPAASDWRWKLIFLRRQRTISALEALHDTLYKSTTTTTTTTTNMPGCSNKDTTQHLNNAFTSKIEPRNTYDDAVTNLPVWSGMAYWHLYNVNNRIITHWLQWHPV